MQGGRGLKYFETITQMYYNGKFSQRQIGTDMIIQFIAVSSPSIMESDS